MLLLGNDHLQDGTMHFYFFFLFQRTLTRLLLNPEDTPTFFNLPLFLLDISGSEQSEDDPGLGVDPDGGHQHPP